MIYIFVLIFLFVLQLVYFRMADRFNIIDKPNERSSHKQVTLRGGGVVFYFGVLTYFLSQGFYYPFFTLGLTLIAGVSFIDDVRTLSSKVRLPVHFISMGLMFYEWGLFSQPWYLVIAAFILSVGIINAYNFMDGINGITGAYSLVVLAVLSYVNSFVSPFVDEVLINFSLIAVLVFNWFNFRKKARCFAGDVGSVSIAFLIVFLLGKLIVETGKLEYLLFLGVYGVDSVLTIIHRLILKENIFEAHRKHAYQLMANELKIPHLFVSLFYAILQLILSIMLIINVLSAVLVLVVYIIGYLLFKKKYFKLHQY